MSIVGRFDIQDEFWKAFSEGRELVFEKGTEIVIAEKGEAGMGDENPTAYKNMLKLAAGMGYKRFTELLETVPLGNNFTFIMSVIDQQVGRLSDDEIEFLKRKNVNLIISKEDHTGAFEDKLFEGINAMLKGTP